MNFSICHEKQIAASTETVWQVLADLPAYPEWNPFVLRCESSLRVNEPIVMQVRLLPWLVLRQKETVRVSEPCSHLEYGVHIPGLLHSRREHVLVQQGVQHTRYESRFVLEGVLAPVVKCLLGRQLEAGFAAMTAALVQRAEA